MIKTIRRNTVLQRSNDQIFSIIDNEVIMLSISNGEYYQLNHIGSLIWGILENPTIFDNLLVALVENYDISADECEEETLSFIDQLSKKGLIKIINE